MSSLVYEGILLAIASAIIIWQITGSKKINKPKELEDGKFAIPKPEDEFMENIEYDEIRTNIKIKQNENNNDYISSSNISDSSSTNN